MIRRTQGERIFAVFNTLFLTLVVILTLYPFWYVVASSISDALRLTQHQGLLLLPLGFDLSAYRMVFMNPMISQGYMNTLFIVVVGTSINMVMTCLSAYVLSRTDVYWRNLIMMLITFTMFFSGGLIPLYLQVKSLGLVNNLMAIILPTAISTYNTIIMRTAFAAVPASLEESAKLDGANDFHILSLVIIPLSLPTIAVIALYYVVGHWNGWFNAMIYMTDRAKYPIQLILREILLNNSTDSMMTSVGGTDKMMIGETIKYATIVVATLPILAVYPFLQKYFVKGVMIGAIKG